jgi:hypothetical protein
VATDLELKVERLTTLVEGVSASIDEIKENMARRPDVDRHEQALKALEDRVRNLEGNNKQTGVMMKLIEKVGTAAIGAALALFVKYLTH